MAKIIGFLVAAAVTVGLIVGLAFLDALVVRDCWNWFVSPLGVRQLSTGWAFGLNLAVWAFIRQPRKEEDLDGKAIGNHVLGILIMWALAWYAHAHWMPSLPSLG